MTRTSRFQILPLVAILTLPVLLFLWYRYSLLPVNSASPKEEVFVVPKGQTTSEILGRLEDEGLIKSSLAAKVLLKLSSNTGSLQAGSFRLSPSQSTHQIFEELKHGTLDAWITIPEGWRAEQIVDKLVEQDLLAETSKSSLYQQFRQYEGRLFPDTYLFAKDSTAEQIIRRLTDTFSQKTDGLSGSRQPITNDTLILASLIEREAKHAQDRPLVAGVLKNRLDIGMALQVDATLQYAKASRDSTIYANGSTADWWPGIAAADKSLTSPYNTYASSGLPPAPISNPGLSSIKAALSPTKVDYLYYISEPDGTTRYAVTLEEHNANIRKYLR